MRPGHFDFTKKREKDKKFKKRHTQEETERNRREDERNKPVF